MTLDVAICGDCVHVELGVEEEGGQRALLACFLTRSVQAFAYDWVESRVIGLGLRCL